MLKCNKSMILSFIIKMKRTSSCVVTEYKVLTLLKDRFTLTESSLSQLCVSAVKVTDVPRLPKSIIHSFFNTT